MKLFLTIWFSLLLIISGAIGLGYSFLWLLDNLTGLQFVIVAILSAITVISLFAYEMIKPDLN